jgi:hypothetical protein
MAGGKRTFDRIMKRLRALRDENARPKNASRAVKKSTRKKARRKKR